MTWAWGRQRRLRSMPTRVAGAELAGDLEQVAVAGADVEEARGGLAGAGEEPFIMGVEAGWHRGATATSGQRDVAHRECRLSSRDGSIRSRPGSSVSDRVALGERPMIPSRPPGLLMAPIVTTIA